MGARAPAFIHGVGNAFRRCCSDECNKIARQPSFSPRQSSSSFSLPLSPSKRRHVRYIRAVKLFQDKLDRSLPRACTSALYRLYSTSTIKLACPGGWRITGTARAAVFPAIILLRDAERASRFSSPSASRPRSNALLAAVTREVRVKSRRGERADARNPLTKCGQCDFSSQETVSINWFSRGRWNFAKRLRVGQSFA